MHKQEATSLETREGHPITRVMLQTMNLPLLHAALLLSPLFSTSRLLPLFALSTLATPDSTPMFDVHTLCQGAPSALPPFSLPGPTFVPPPPNPSRTSACSSSSRKSPWHQYTKSTRQQHNSNHSRWKIWVNEGLSMQRSSRGGEAAYSEV